METKDCNLLYNEHTCTENYYRYLLGYMLTDGILNVAETEKCFWFIDIIVSAQIDSNVKNEEFQCWYLKRVHGNEFVIFGTNGNWVEDISKYEGMTQKENDRNILYSQDIPFSDFKFDIFKVFVSNIDKVIYLPSEH